MFKHTVVPEIEELQSKIKCKNLKGRRLYTVDGTEKAYPSITTILGSLSKAGIMAWRKRVGAEEANRISQQASTKGTKVHSLVEDFINNKEVDIEKEQPHINAAFNAIKGELKRNLTEIYAQECGLYSDYLKLGGRVDCVGIYSNKLSIIDFKTSRRNKTRDDIHSYFMQEAAYAIMFEERTGMPVTQLVTIMAVDGQLNPVVFIEKRDDWTKQLMKTVYDYHINN